MKVFLCLVPGPEREQLALRFDDVSQVITLQRCSRSPAGLSIPSAAHPVPGNHITMGGVCVCEGEGEEEEEKAESGGLRSGSSGVSNTNWKHVARRKHGAILAE